MKKSLSRTSVFLTMLLILSMMSVGVSAQEPAEIEIDRDPTDIAEILHPDPDRDSVDTAIVFTSLQPTYAVIRCKGFGHNGHVIGNVRLLVPPNGLRYLRGSDVSAGRDFIGHVRCSTSGASVTASAFIVGTGSLANAPVEELRLDSVTNFRVPVVASF